MPQYHLYSVMRSSLNQVSAVLPRSRHDLTILLAGTSTRPPSPSAEEPQYPEKPLRKRRGYVLHSDDADTSDDDGSPHNSEFEALCAQTRAAKAEREREWDLQHDFERGLVPPPEDADGVMVVVPSLLPQHVNDVVEVDIEMTNSDGASFVSTSSIRTLAARGYDWVYYTSEYHIYDSACEDEHWTAIRNRMFSEWGFVSQVLIATGAYVPFL